MRTHPRHSTLSGPPWFGVAVPLEPLGVPLELDRAVAAPLCGLCQPQQVVILLDSLSKAVPELREKLSLAISGGKGIRVKARLETVCQVYYR